MTLWLAPALLLALVAAADAPGDDPCVEARRLHRWCDARDVGFIAGVEVRSKELYEALDAHGHDYDTSRQACEICKRAQAEGGVCEQHGIGFVNGKAYLSRLSYYTFRGETFTPEEFPCRDCPDAARPYRWCEECSLGYVGNVLLRDRDDYDHLARAYDLLQKAIDRADRCETCAAAMIIDGICPIHRLRFRDGEEEPLTRP